MTDLTNAITNTIPISVFNRGLAGKIFEEVRRCGAKVVMKNNAAECVLLSPDEYVRLMEEVNDARFLALATERMASSDLSKAVSEEDALKKLGIDRADIDGMEEVEIE